MGATTYIGNTQYTDKFLFSVGLSINCLFYTDMFQRTQDKPSVLVTSPGSPEMAAPVRHRTTQPTRLNPANQNVGGRLQVIILTYSL